MNGYERTPREAALAVRLLDGVPDGLLLIDARGLIVMANRSASSMFGYADGGLVGKSVDELVPDGQRLRHGAHRRRYEQQPEVRPMGTGMRLFAQHRSGVMFPVEVSLSPITIDGEVRTVSTIRDITEREAATAQLLLHEDHLRIASDLHDLVIQRIFAAGMSLQSVTNLVESPMARERIVTVTDELDETVRTIRAATLSIGTRTDSQSLASHLNSVVHDRSRHLGFTPDLVIVGAVDDLPDFVADQLVATLTEAVSNVARHANATDAEIRITRTGGTMNLEVLDDGCGIGATPKPLGGLSNLMWRAAELGGWCSVTPIEPSGTKLVWQVPV